MLQQTEDRQTKLQAKVAAHLSALDNQEQTGWKQTALHPGQVTTTLQAVSLSRLSPHGLRRRDLSILQELDKLAKMSPPTSSFGSIGARAVQSRINEYDSWDDEDEVLARGCSNLKVLGKGKVDRNFSEQAEAWARGTRLTEACLLGLEPSSGEWELLDEISRSGDDELARSMPTTDGGSSSCASSFAGSFGSSLYAAAASHAHPPEVEVSGLEGQEQMLGPFMELIAANPQRSRRSAPRRPATVETSYVRNSAAANTSLDMSTNQLLRDPCSSLPLAPAASSLPIAQPLRDSCGGGMPMRLPSSPAASSNCLERLQRRGMPMRKPSSHAASLSCLERLQQRGSGSDQSSPRTHSSETQTGIPFGSQANSYCGSPASPQNAFRIF